MLTSRRVFPVGSALVLAGILITTPARITAQTTARQ
jgi:hypothetical protein